MDIISTLAFFNGFLKKTYYQSKDFTQESCVLMENIKRFDLVFTFSGLIGLLDFKRRFDNTSISYSAGNRNTGSTFNKQSEVNFEFLRNYIIFIRKNFKPTLSMKASVFIKNAYVFLKISRKKSVKGIIAEKKRFSQLESMIKVAEAIAKMRMANKIDSNDALEAIRLVQDFGI